MIFMRISSFTSSMPPTSSNFILGCSMSADFSAPGSPDSLDWLHDSSTTGTFSGSFFPAPGFDAGKRSRSSEVSLAHRVQLQRLLVIGAGLVAVPFAEVEAREENPCGRIGGGARGVIPSVRTMASEILPSRWRIFAMPSLASTRPGSRRRTRSKVSRPSSRDHSSMQAFARRSRSGTLSGDRATAGAQRFEFRHGYLKVEEILQEFFCPPA